MMSVKVLLVLFFGPICETSKIVDLNKNILTQPLPSHCGSCRSAWVCSACDNTRTHISNNAFVSSAVLWNIYHRRAQVRHVNKNKHCSCCILLLFKLPQKSIQITFSFSLVSVKLRSMASNAFTSRRTSASSFWMAGLV